MKRLYSVSTMLFHRVSNQMICVRWRFVGQGGEATDSSPMPNIAKETVLECVQEATSGLLKVPTNRLQHLLALGLRRHTNPGQGMFVSCFLTSGRSNL